jgi:TolB protein
MFSLKCITRREAVTALFTAGVSRPVFAQINAGSARVISIAVSDFFGDSQDELEKGRTVANGIASDLRDSGRFTLVDPGTGIAINTDIVPKFNDWRALNADCLVTGRLSLQSDGRFKVEFRLWEIVAAAQLSAAQYFVAANQWHRVPHVIADSIYERLTGQVGRFDNENKN